MSKEISVKVSTVIIIAIGVLAAFAVFITMAMQPKVPAGVMIQTKQRDVGSGSMRDYKSDIAISFNAGDTPGIRKWENGVMYAFCPPGFHFEWFNNAIPARTNFREDIPLDAAWCIVNPEPRVPDAPLPRK